MALASVSPTQPTPTAPSSEDDSVGNGIKIPQNPVPNVGSTDPTQAAATMKSGAAMTQAMNNVAQAKSSSSGGLFGAIGSVIGKAIPLIGGLFAKGGMVDCGYAAGGPTMNPDNTYGPGQMIEPPGPSQPTDPNAPNMSAFNDAMGIGYAIGALHQRDYGGTPDTLEQAAASIGQLMGNNQPQGFAPGGSVSTMPANPMMRPPQPMQSTVQPQLPAQPQHPMSRPYGGDMPAPKPMTGGQIGPTNPAVSLPAQPKGFVPQMAMGGTPPVKPTMGGQAPTLQPGQPFMGEGAVKGPGGPMDDAIPAKLSNGEYVMSAPAVAFFGVEKMDKMNEAGKQGFMQSKAQVQMNQSPSGDGGPAPATDTGMASPMPEQGAGLMPKMPMMQAQGGPAVTRSRGSGYMG